MKTLRTAQIITARLIVTLVYLFILALFIIFFIAIAYDTLNGVWSTVVNLVGRFIWMAFPNTVTKITSVIDLRDPIKWYLIIVSWTFITFTMGQSWYKGFRTIWLADMRTYRWMKKRLLKRAQKVKEAPVPVTLPFIQVPIENGEVIKVTE